MCDIWSLGILLFIWCGFCCLAGPGPASILLLPFPRDPFVGSPRLALPASLGKCRSKQSRPLTRSSRRSRPTNSTPTSPSSKMSTSAPRSVARSGMDEVALGRGVFSLSCDAQHAFLLLLLLFFFSLFLLFHLSPSSSSPSSSASWQTCCKMTRRGASRQRWASNVASMITSYSAESPAPRLPALPPPHTVPSHARLPSSGNPRPPMDHQRENEHGQ